MMKTEMVDLACKAEGQHLASSDDHAKGRLALMVGVGVMVGMYASGAWAADPMSAGMCWFVKALTGKWVFGASVIGMIATGIAFIAGVEMNEFVKKVAAGVLVACFMLGATSMITALASAVGSTAVAC